MENRQTSKFTGRAHRSDVSFVEAAGSGGDFDESIRAAAPVFLQGMQSTADFEKNGFFVCPDLLADHECDLYIKKVESLNLANAGTRNLLEYSWCRALAHRLKNHAGIMEALPEKPVAVQCTLFAKSARGNWSVVPHQDLSIPVASKVGDPHCSRWTNKEGVLFTQPSEDVLESLVAVRVHLDACREDSGPLSIVPGSHRFGRLSNLQLRQAFHSSHTYVCTVPRGAGLIMRPLLIHASSRITASVNRRVLHFLFGPAFLPFGLKWANAF